MAFTRPPQDYRRSPQPALPESQKLWLEEELRKLERAVQSIVEALNELESRVTALEP